ncbi:MAG TPA: tRNA pseudouridine(55) synthase TruB [Ruminococcaceae bacterium]|nr:tRNA pseudouridine(55) synthase TruB [Oscillospiraceae bacterium]
MDGILILNKSEGITSFGVVARVRGITHTRKVGHAGTLDPMATGVLPIFLGRATRAIGLLPCSDKTYIAKLKLGVRTDTGDRTGKIIGTKSVTVGKAEMESVLPAFRGQIMQIPPMYSAIHQNGKRLYELARMGKVVERKARPITIYRLLLLQADEKAGVYSLLVSCSSGTYIRTLIEDIGEKLGCGAIMTALDRTEAAGFSEKNAVTVSDLESYAKEDTLAMHLLPIEYAFETLEMVTVTDKQAIRFCNGGFLSLERVNGVPSSGLCRVYAPSKVFLGLGEINQEKQALLVKCNLLGSENNGSLSRR